VTVSSISLVLDMSIYMGRCWKCETCNEVDNKEPWACPICGKETCEHCFGYNGVCDHCCDGKTQDEIKAIIGYVDED
jgi:hypothetical protein